MCLAQFATYYDTIPAKDCENIVFSDGVYGQNNEKKIASWNAEYKSPLPTHIKLNNGLIYMKLRNIPAVLRIYKLKEDKDPHEYLYSQVILYMPWQHEVELCEKDEEACLKLCQEMEEEELSKDDGSQRSKIEKIQDSLFPHKNNVEATRAVVENFIDTWPTHIGDQLDPENEKANEE